MRRCEILSLYAVGPANRRSLMRWRIAARVGCQLAWARLAAMRAAQATASSTEVGVVGGVPATVLILARVPERRTKDSAAASVLAAAARPHRERPASAANRQTTACPRMRRI